MKYLTTKHILLVHDIEVEQSGGTHGVRDHKLLASAVSLPHMSQYQGIHMKAAGLMRSLIQSHPFVDGNKRTGVLAAGVFLERNGYTLTAKRGHLRDLAISIAKGKLEIKEITEWVRRHSKKRQA